MGMRHTRSGSRLLAVNEVIGCQDILRSILNHLDVPARVRASSSCKALHDLDMYDVRGPPQLSLGEFS
jgi:hypothetical protein